jgi:NAD(P)-dependent dehydrogenase (short-subunit alcohol dehydrogenase family)
MANPRIEVNTEALLFRITNSLYLQKDFGGQALPIRCDATVTGDIQNMVEKTTSTYGAMDMSVNNAGVLHGATVLETEMSDF